MAESRSLITRHVSELVTVGDEKALSVGRALVQSDRARETQQRRLAATYRQVAEMASQAGLQTSTGAARAARASREQAGSVQLLASKQQVLSKALLGSARAQLTEERALQTAERQAVAYTRATDMRIAAARRATVAATQEAAATARASRAVVIPRTTAPVGGAGKGTAAYASASRGAGSVSALAGGVAATAGAGGIFALGNSVKQALDFEEQMSAVRAVVQGTAKDERDLTKVAIDLGAKTRYSASEAADAMDVLAKAGFGVNQIISALPGTMALAAASGTDLATSANIQTVAIRSYDLAASKAGHVADVLTLAANKSSIDVTDIGETLKYVAPVALAAGQSFEGTAAALAVMGNNGIKASMAGTGLRAIMARLVKPTLQSQGALQGIGLTVKDLQGPNGLLPLPQIIDKLRVGLNKLPKAEQLRVLTTVFGREPLAAINTLVQKGSGQLRTFTEDFRHADGAAAATAKTMQGNVKAGFEQLGGAIESGTIRSLQRFEPEIKSAALSAAGAIDSFTKNPENLDRIGDLLGNVASAAKDTAAPFVTLAKVGAGAVSMFASLDGGIQRTILHTGALILVSRKLATSDAVAGLRSRVGGGAGKATAAVAAVPAIAPTAAVAARAAIPVASFAPIRQMPSTVTIPAGRLGTSGFGASRLVEVETAKLEQGVLGAQRAASIRMRQAVAARAGLADAQIAEAAAERAAISARAVPRTAQNREVVAANLRSTEAQVAAARSTTVAARESMVAANAESAAAKTRLVSAREVQTLAARQAVTTAAATAAPAASVGRIRGALKRIPTPRVTGKGAIGVAAAGGIGAALSGGSVAGGAAAGAGIGLMGGPWGAAGGAAAGAGITALVNEFKQASTKRSEAAASDFAKRATAGTTRATARGFQGADAKAVGKASATLTAGREAISLYNRGTAEYGSGKSGSIGRGGDLRQQATNVAKSAGLDINALLKGNSRAFAAAQRAAGVAGQNTAKAWAEGLKRYKAADATSLMASFEKLPREARQEGANAMIELARGMEKAGVAPKGTVKALIADLGREADHIVPVVAGVAAKSVKLVDTALKDRKVAASADRLMGHLSEFAQIPKIAVKSVPGAVASLGAGLTELQRIVKDKNTSKQVRELAEKEMPGARAAYDKALAAMSERMGMSKKDVQTWADSVVHASIEAGHGSINVDTLANSARRYTDRINDATTALDSFIQSNKDLAKLPLTGIDPGGGGAGTGRKVQRPHQKARRGGPIRAYAGGGYVDTMMSGGEEYLPPSVASMYPAGMLDAIGQMQAPHFVRGGPVGGHAPQGRRLEKYGLGGMIIPGLSDRDGTYVAAQPGGFVLTGHGQALRDQMMGYAKGGTVVRGKVSTFGPPGEAAGSMASGLSSSAAGIALNLRPGTDSGWNNATTDRWVKARQMFSVTIGSHVANLPVLDKGPAGSTGRAIDVTGAGARKMGINPANFPTDQLGTAVVGANKGAAGARTAQTAGKAGYSYTKTTDDITGLSARDAHRQRATLREPNVDVSGVFDQARAGTYDAIAKANLLKEIVSAGRVNIERQKVTVAGIAGSKASRAGMSGTLPSRSDVVEKARGLRSSNLMGANPGMGTYGRLGKYFDLNVTSGKRATGGRTASGGISQHGTGDAIDLSGGSSRMLRFAKWLGSSGIARMADQVIHTPLGYGWNRGKKVGLGFFGDAVNKGHYDHVHVGDSTPPSFRRGGRVRRFATGGRVGTAARVTRDVGRASSSPAISKALSSMYGSSIRQVKPVTDALEQLQTLLGQVSTVTVDQLEAMGEALQRSIDLTRSKKSPGGTAITKAEQAQIKRSQSALSLVNAGLGQRSGTAAAAADFTAQGIEDRAGMIDRSLRRSGISSDSARGLALQGRNMSWAEGMKGVELGQLQRSLAAQQARGSAGKEQATEIAKEIHDLTNDISDLTVQRIENARAQVAAAAQERVDASQFTLDMGSAGLARGDALRSLAGTSDTAGGLAERAGQVGGQIPAIQALQQGLAQQAADALKINDTAGWRQATLAAQQAGTDAIQALADAADLMRQAVTKAAQDGVDRVQFGLDSQSNALGMLDATQALSRTADTPGGMRQRAEMQQGQIQGFTALRDQYLSQATIAASLYGTDSDQFRSAMLAAQQAANQAVQTMADSAQAFRDASLKAIQDRIDDTAHGTSMANLGLQGLELQQRLNKTYDGGGADRAGYIQSSVIPALQAELEALKQKQAEDERQGNGPATKQDMEAIVGKQNEILQAQLDKQDAIEQNTAPRAYGGGLGFEYQGQAMSDIVYDGVGA